MADLEVERGELLQLAQQLDRLVELHRERRPALGEAFDRDLGGAELADRVLEADQLREVAERADLELDLALEDAVEDLAVPVAVGVPGSTSVAGVCASVSSCTRRLTSTASRSAFIRIRVAWPRAWAWISSSRAETASSEAMLRSWRSLASRRRSVRPRISRSRSITIPDREDISPFQLGHRLDLALAFADLASPTPNPAVPHRDRRVHLGGGSRGGAS